MNRCVIITAFQSISLPQAFDFCQSDFIICADGGYDHAMQGGIHPHVLIGDFDSLGKEALELQKDFEDSGGRVLRLPAEKDDTDTLYCLKYGIKLGFEDFFILGGLGGRLDHTIANLQTMSYAIDRQKKIWFLDGKNKATLRNPGELTIPKEDGMKLSLFSFGDSCQGVSIKGVKYPLDSCRLENSFPLGVSNEFAEDSAAISHTAGKLLIVLSQD